MVSRSGGPPINESVDGWEAAERHCKRSSGLVGHMEWREKQTKRPIERERERGKKERRKERKKERKSAEAWPQTCAKSKRAGVI